jgi:hypothetical protein
MSFHPGFEREQRPQLVTVVNRRRKVLLGD